MRRQPPEESRPPARPARPSRPGIWPAHLTGHPHLPLMLRGLRLGFFDVSQFDGPCWYSDRYLAMLGYGAEHRAQFQAGFRPLIHPQDVPALRSRLERRGRQRLTHTVYEARVMRCEGSWVWVRWIGVVSERAPDGTPLRVVGTMENIQAPKRREAALVEARDDLAALVDHANQAIEDERRRLAGEVHDQLGQMLTLLGLEIDRLATETGRREALRPVLDGLRRHVDDALQASRRIALRMRPAMLDFGLVPALRWLAEDFDTRTGCTCVFSHGRGVEVTLPDAAATALFRIAQEAMSNAVRHAGPCGIVMRLDRAGRSLKLVVTDDGAGFDPAAVRGRARLGLSGMRERAQRVGARWSLHSGPGQGTRVEVLLPLA